MRRAHFKHMSRRCRSDRRERGLGVEQPHAVHVLAALVLLGRKHGRAREFPAARCHEWGRTVTSQLIEHGTHLHLQWAQIDGRRAERLASWRRGQWESLRETVRKARV